MRDLIAELEAATRRGRRAYLTCHGEVLLMPEGRTVSVAEWRRMMRGRR